MEKMLKDKVAIITGSGRGIGRTTAMMFAREGARVVISDIDAQPADETVQDIKKAGGEAVAYVGDATSDDFAKEIVAVAADTWGGIDIIVNNAGFTWDSMLHKMTDEQWDTILNLHLKTPFRLIRAAKPFFCDAAQKEMEEGKTVPARKIINISSIAGIGGNVGQANYSAAKSGIIGLTKTVGKEWARYNVQANAVAFGMIDTRMTQAKEIGEAVEHEGEKIAVGVPEKQRRMIEMMIPMGRAGSTEEAASAILFFASPLSNYVSGQCLVVSGGLMV
ncbi:SDR family NAD(P)-dependent oxidoreductase [Desulforhopalus singaporensis]|uniref:3-oxoacyl-[acyl-carrier protein] reductase n=1 Tax=Desulforhopalus singaporensis TaxID=91360 RepID=A0A1H0VGY4_9BACT|nr:SDR family oxidoreductase [Desulforhopalus singaporensis]SDP77465.1 3-oxoacyl-[acyl-carrier protein] reductase [Desulforhopalus singaporensis]